MGPRKEKAEKAGVDGSAMILDYLKKQKYKDDGHLMSFDTAVAGRLMRRFYAGVTVGLIQPLTSQPTSIRRLPKVSATLDQWIFTFSANCMVNKAYAAKALKEMHERREIEGRVSGKQTVYHTIQDPADDASPESLAAIDKELEGLREEIAGGKTREKALKAELATLNSRVSTADLRQGVLKLEAEKGEMSVRLSAMCNRAVQPVSVEEKARVDKEWKVWKRHMNVRKRICRDLWDRCTEVLPEDTTKEDLWESLGLEGEL